MTTFWRNGFWRTSVNGVLHWVDGHDVDRSIWSRGSGGSSHFASLLSNTRAGTSFSATFVNPNAECPVCGAAVFFYQNAAGSRVFFDELGPPWPKHPCTDNSGNGRRRNRTNQERLAPYPRDTEEAKSIERWLEHAGLSPLEDFHSKYGLSPWVAYVLEGPLKQGKQKVLVLRKLSEPRAASKRVYVLVKQRLSGVGRGDIVFYYKGWLSYLDADHLHSTDVEGTRLKGASAAVDALLGIRAVA
jgi:hypothetical protein